MTGGGSCAARRSTRSSAAATATATTANNHGTTFKNLMGAKRCTVSAVTHRKPPVIELAGAFRGLGLPRQGTSLAQETAVMSDESKEPTAAEVALVQPPAK